MTKPAAFADLPGPKGLPLLGSLLQIDPARLHLILEAWAERYGPRYRFRLGPKPVLVAEEGTAFSEREVIGNAVTMLPSHLRIRARSRR
jgi:hypothetical protein